MERQRILVTVKTYPTLSKKYGETVCTAGVREDGTWVRIYPVPFRRLGRSEQYKKYDWIECSLARRTADIRPESYSPANPSEIQPIGHMSTFDNWRDRRRLLLQKAQVYDQLDTLIEGAKQNELSLAVFKPSRIHNLIWEQEERNWDEAKLRQMREMHDQLGLFEDNSWRKTFKMIPKLPYSFSYRFTDANGRRSELQILDWEIGALYWNCMKLTGNDERAALAKVKQKYFDEFVTKDLHFYLGTTQQFHKIAPNPWVIVGVLPIPCDQQERLL